MRTIGIKVSPAGNELGWIIFEPKVMLQLDKFRKTRGGYQSRSAMLYLWKQHLHELIVANRPCQVWLTLEETKEAALKQAFLQGIIEATCYFLHVPVRYVSATTLRLKQKQIPQRTRGRKWFFELWPGVEVSTTHIWMADLIVMMGLR